MALHQRDSLAVLSAASPDNGCGCGQLRRDELALIGAAFLSGVGFGKGLPMPMTSPGVLPPDGLQRSVHPIPTLPITLNGKAAAREAVKDFDGQPLYYVLDEAALAGERVPVFSAPEKARAFLAQQAAPPHNAATGAALISIGTGSSAQEIADAIGGAVLLFEHSNYGGAQWQFTTGTTGYPSHGVGDGNITDFRSVFCFLWWCTNINDRVSSIQNLSEVWAYVRPQRSFAVLHEHINFGGAQLWVPERATIPDLSPYGWNDRASSLSYVVI